MSAAPAPNRIGLRSIEINELTVIAPMKPGGADRFRALVASASSDEAALSIGTLHDARFVFFDDDTRLLFATAYDGDWDSYIDDFGTKIPVVMDTLFGEVDGWPGITSPDVKDFIAAHQIEATTWFCAYGDLRVSDIERHRRIAAAVDGLLDAAG